MSPELFNCILYIGLLLYYIKKYKHLDTFLCLLSAYTFTAVMCFLYLNTGNTGYDNTTYIGYIYLFACVIISISPFKNFSIEHLEINETKTIKILTWIYIVSGILAIYYTLPETIKLFQSGEWGKLRNELYEDESNIALYHSQFEQLIKNIHSYLNPFGIVMCFYFLTKKDCSKWNVILIFTSWLGSTFLGATLVASRGLVADTILQIFIVYVIFKNQASIIIKKVFTIVSIFIVGLFLIYMLEVSDSRFGDEANKTIFMYLGHSMPCFNERILGTMTDYAYGQYFFNYFSNFLQFNPDIDEQALGITAAKGFYTFVGSFYIDLGPLFTIVFFILLGLFLYSYVNKKHKNLSDLIIIVYFATFFMEGVFVVGKGLALQWLMLAVVYFIVRWAESNKQIKKTNV